MPAAGRDQAVAGRTIAGVGAGLGDDRTLFGRDAVDEESEGHPVLPSDPQPPPSDVPRSPPGGGAGRTITSSNLLETSTEINAGPRRQGRSSTRFGVHLLDEGVDIASDKDTSLGGGPGTMVGVGAEMADEALSFASGPERLDDAWLDDVSEYLKGVPLGGPDAADAPTDEAAGRKPARRPQHSGESPTVEIAFDASLFHEPSGPRAFDETDRPESAAGRPVLARRDSDSAMAVGRRPMLSGDQPTVRLDAPERGTLQIYDDPFERAADTDAPGGPAPDDTQFGRVSGAYAQIRDERGAAPGSEILDNDSAPYSYTAEPQGGSDIEHDAFFDLGDVPAPAGELDFDPDDLDLDFDSRDEKDDADEPADERGDAPDAPPAADGVAPLAAVMRRKRRPDAGRPAAPVGPGVARAGRTGSRLALGEDSARAVLDTFDGPRRQPRRPISTPVPGPATPQVTLDSSPLTLSAYDSPRAEAEPYASDDPFGDTTFAPAKELAFASTGSMPPIPDRIERPVIPAAPEAAQPKPSPRPEASQPPRRPTREQRKPRQPALAAVQYLEGAPDGPDDRYVSPPPPVRTSASAPAPDFAFDGEPETDRDDIFDGGFGQADPYEVPAAGAFDEAPSTELGAGPASVGHGGPSRVLLATLAVLVLTAITLGAFVILKAFVL